MSSDNDLLLRRLVGAATVFFGAFLLAWLLPQPEEGESEQDGTVVLRMHAPEPRSRPERLSSVEERAESPSSDARRAAAPDRASEARPLPAAPAPADTRAASSAEPAPSAERKAAANSDSREAAPQAAPANGGEWWIQAAAYSDQAAAGRGRKLVAAEFSAGSRLREVEVDGRRFWRLQVGPLAREAAAERLAERLREQGFQGARTFREARR